MENLNTTNNPTKQDLLNWTFQAFNLLEANLITNDEFQSLVRNCKSKIDDKEFISLAQGIPFPSPEQLSFFTEAFLQSEEAVVQSLSKLMQSSASNLRFLLKPIIEMFLVLPTKTRQSFYQQSFTRPITGGILMCGTSVKLPHEFHHNLHTLVIYHIKSYLEHGLEYGSTPDTVNNVLADMKAILDPTFYQESVLPGIAYSSSIDYIDSHRDSLCIKSKKIQSYIATRLYYGSQRKIQSNHFFSLVDRGLLDFDVKMLTGTHLAQKLLENKINSLIYNVKTNSAASLSEQLNFLSKMAKHDTSFIDKTQSTLLLNFRNSTEARNLNTNSELAKAFLKFSIEFDTMLGKPHNSAKNTLKI